MHGRSGRRNTSPCRPGDGASPRALGLASPQGLRIARQEGEPLQCRHPGRGLLRDSHRRRGSRRPTSCEGCAAGLTLGLATSEWDRAAQKNVRATKRQQRSRADFPPRTGSVKTVRAHVLPCAHTPPCCAHTFLCAHQKSQGAAVCAHYSYTPLCARKLGVLDAPLGYDSDLGMRLHHGALRAGAVSSDFVWPPWVLWGGFRGFRGPKGHQHTRLEVSMARQSDSPRDGATESARSPGLRELRAATESALRKSLANGASGSTRTACGVRGSATPFPSQLTHAVTRAPQMGSTMICCIRRWG